MRFRRKTYRATRGRDYAVISQALEVLGVDPNKATRVVIDTDGTVTVTVKA